MKQKFNWFLLVTLFSINLYSQKTVGVCGEHTYHAPENVTLEQAKQTALDRAKLQALADKFGTTVAQQNSTVVKNENGKSDISFLSVGGSEVKGEWIENIEDPKYEISYVQNMLIVKCSVCGKAREIVGAGIDFSAKILNNANSKYETNNFHNGEDVFLSFRSPVNGYIAVYLIDDNQNAFCLLPYSKDNTGRVKLKAGKDYVFFSESHAEKDEKQFVTEYSLYCEKSLEQNTIYIIFSPNEFTKANDSQGQADGKNTLPRELSYGDFQKWLQKNQQRDKDMKVEIKSITIKK